MGNIAQNRVLQEVQKAIIGKNDIIEKVFAAILSGGHILLEDVPGVGKTTLALAFSKTLGLACKRIQFTSDTMPSDVLGFSVYNQAQNTFVYQPGPVMTNLLLADELNRTSGKTQGALLEVMEEKHVTVDGQTYDLPTPFVVLATQNPVGSAGTQMLPASQLDRFMIRLSMGYPDFDSQVALLKDRHHRDPLAEITQVTDRETLLHMQQQVAGVHIADAVYAYITRLVQATRDHEQIDLGLSPRGALALCRFAQAYAFLCGHTYVTPTDIKAIFCDVVAHRLVLSRKARIAGREPKEVLAEILQKTEMPQITVEEPQKV